MAALEIDVESGRILKPIAAAVSAFLGQCSTESSTFKKYARWLDRLTAFAKRQDCTSVGEIDLEFLDAYRQTRAVCALTWSKELQLLRTFFSFCQQRKWCEENPAKKMKMPPDPKPKERKPYEPEEIAKIIAACDTFGRHAYERLRARAMILLMRFYGLRVSDVATLSRDRINTDAIYLHAQKNKVPVWLPLVPAVRQALACLPHPQGAAYDCNYLFWSGTGSREGHVKTVDRTLQAVFRKSGVPGAHAHRFRHYATSRTMLPRRTPAAFCGLSSQTDVA